MRSTTIISILIYSILLLAACGDDEETKNAVIQISSMSVDEGNDSNTMANFIVTITSSPSSEITLTYRTEAFSAKAQDDFLPVTAGSITVAPGETSITIPLEIIGDNHLELTEKFRMVFDEHPQATFSQTQAFVTIIDNDLSNFEIQKDDEGYITPATYPSMEQVWVQEFDGAALSDAVWNYELGDGCPDLCGWGNSELQFYAQEESNVSLQDGKLVINAIKNSAEPAFTSARITTQNKQEIQFGRIDIRAKLPEGQGIWPAIWMLGSNIPTVGWPRCGEIDIMELVGHEPNKVHGTAHYDVQGHKFTGNSFEKTTGKFSDEFHVFTILWEENSIKWLVDYDLYYQISSSAVGSTYPFNAPFFFIVNIAVGGQWPGNPDETTQFPQSLTLDYIRVFQ